jgi:hypothetical protein
MERARLSGGLLVRKPPQGGRPIRPLRLVGAPGETEAASGAEAAPASPRRRRRFGLQFAAIGVALVAIASVAGLAAILPTRGTAPNRTTIFASIPTAAARLAKGAVETLLRPPALHPAAITVPPLPHPASPQPAAAPANQPVVRR